MVSYGTGVAEPLASSLSSERTTSVRIRGAQPSIGERTWWARSAAAATSPASPSSPWWKWMRKCAVSTVRQR